MTRFSALMVAVCLLAGCTSWQEVEGVTPRQFISTEHPSVVQVVRRVEYTRSGGRNLYGITVDNPAIAGDRLVGASEGKPVSVALYDVQGILVRRFNGTKTSGLLLIPLLAAGLVACASGNC